MRRKTRLAVAALCLCTAFQSMNAQVADRSEYLLTIQEEFETLWPNNHCINLVFHGHSVPAGYFQTPEVKTTLAYPRKTWEALKADYKFAVINAFTTAIGGENAIQGAERMASDVLVHRPDVLFIDYSLNDRSKDLAEVRTAWASMIEEALDYGTRVILLTPTPDTTEDLFDDESKLAIQAAQVRELAEEFHVGLVDSYQAFRDKVSAGTELSTLMAQSNHPNAAGHAIVCEEIMRWFSLEDNGVYETVEQTLDNFESNENTPTQFTSIVGVESQQEVLPTVVANPEKCEMNQTDSCLYVRTKQDVAGKVPGWWGNSVVLTLDEPITFTEENRYLHILHHKGQVLHTWMIYGITTAGASIELGRGDCPAAGEWFDMVVDARAKVSDIAAIRIILDGNWAAAGGETYYAPTDFYYDEIVLSNKATARTSVATSGLEPNTASADALSLYVSDNNQLHLTSPYTMGTIEIRSAAGTLVYQAEAGTIDVSTLSTGVYIVSAQTTQGSVAKTFIKK